MLAVQSVTSEPGVGEAGMPLADNEWLELKKPAVWVPIAVSVAITLVAGLITFATTMGSVQTRIEDLGKNQERFEDRAQKSLETLQSKMDARYDQETEAERRQDSSFQSSIVELKTQVMMLLCGPMKRPLLKGCTVKSLVVQAKSVSKSQAEVLQSATVQLTKGDQPQVASEDVKDELPQVIWGTAGVTTYFPQNHPGARVSDILLWSAAAKSAHWSQEDGNVRATFVNGDAMFKVDPHMSKEHLTKLVESLNDTTEVLKTASSSAVEKK
jgi:hypothetical protein